MKGHHALIAMRCKGSAPSVVWIDTAECPVRPWRNWHEIDPGNAHVLVEPDDFLHRLDLRFAVGMTVHVEGVDRERIAAVRDACIEAGAKRVLTMFWVGGFGGHSERTDTDGVLQWQQ